jgi:hypothetical protein
MDRDNKQGGPFPNPEIPSFDEEGLPVPPWVKYPNIPLGSIGWRMGLGEDYLSKFASRYCAQKRQVQVNVMRKYPEPQGWEGFYHRTKP